MVIVGRLRRDTWLGLRWRLLFDRACDFVSNCDSADKLALHCAALTSPANVAFLGKRAQNTSPQREFRIGQELVVAMPTTTVACVAPFHKSSNLRGCCRATYIRHSHVVSI